jgi:hypothetical protein
MEEGPFEGNGPTRFFLRFFITEVDTGILTGTRGPKRTRGSRQQATSVLCPLAAPFRAQTETSLGDPQPLLVSNMSYSPRSASVTRNTNETNIIVRLNLDATPGSGIQQEIDIKTGVGFLDHVRGFH